MQYEVTLTQRNMTRTCGAAIRLVLVILSCTCANARVSAQLGNLKGPRKIKDVKPVYPPKSLQAGDEGMVIVEFSGDESGTVAAARVLFSKCPALDQAALTAVRGWRFEQVTMNGFPVPFSGTASIPFRLPPKLKSRAGSPGACRWVDPPKPMF
jgi:TonB family protein